MQKQDDQEEIKSFREYGKYFSMAIKMGVLIFAGVYGGLLLDRRFYPGKTLFTVIGSLLGIGLAIYSVIRDILHANRD